MLKVYDLNVRVKFMRVYSFLLVTKLCYGGGKKDGYLRSLMCRREINIILNAWVEELYGVVQAYGNYITKRVYRTSTIGPIY